MASQVSASEDEWNDEEQMDADPSEEDDTIPNHVYYEQIISEQERVHIHQVFNGEVYLPMMFVRTEYERLQRESIARERIAHHMRAHTEFDASLKERMRQKQVFFNSLAYRETVGCMRSAQKIRFQESLLPFRDDKSCNVVADLDVRIYCGGFSPDGEQFLVAGQHKDILFFRVSDWKEMMSVPVREMRWTVTDAKYTPSGRHVLYSTITNKIRMVDVGAHGRLEEHTFHLHAHRRMQNEESIRNRRERPRPLDRFGVWCFDINAAGTEFIAGTSSSGVVLYDMEVEAPVCHVVGHSDDVNTVAFVDGLFHSNVFVTGSDDSLIKVWDRRVLSESNTSPQGIYSGHTDGITHISSRDDGFYFISNSKDQTCKLWDLRRNFSASEFSKLPKFKKPYYWDYRYEPYPGRNRLPISHPHDQSVMTYRGHCVMQTLIRCYFSPIETTAQKYVYTGSADGRVYVYDVLDGGLVHVFATQANGVTRDIRWHPSEPMIVSPDFDGKLCVWQRTC